MHTSRPARRFADFPFPLFLIAVGSAGLFFGLPNAVYHFPLFALLYPCSLYALSVTAPSAPRAFLRGWLLGLGGSAAGLYWLVYPLHDVAGMPLPLAIPAIVVLFFYLALYSALSALAVRNLSLLSGTGSKWRSLLPPLLGGLAYGGFEVIGGTLFSGFPWLSLSTCLAFQPVCAQAASLVGAYGVSALLACAAFCATSVCLNPPGHRLAGLAVAFAIVLALPAYGVLRTSQPPLASGPPLRVIMVQGNIDQSIKWEPAYQKSTLDWYLKLSKSSLLAFRSSLNAAPPDLVIWPETAMPFYFQLHQEFAGQILRFASDNGIHLAFGAPGLLPDPRRSSLLNRLYLVSPAGRVEGTYDKEHLVPFGEYTPFAVDLPFLEDILQGMSFTPGANDRPLRLERRNGPPVTMGALICYEAIFPDLAQKRVEDGAEVLINVSNDGWFRKSSAPLQHLAHAILRAIEQSRPLLRATNTGITALIDPRGAIASLLPGTFVEGTLTVRVEPVSEITLYHRIHPLPELLLAVLSLFSLFAHRIRPRKPRTTNVSTR